jgi:hypothetical protein
MNLIDNSGADATLIKQGYKVLDGGPERCRDEQLVASQNLKETEDGGFLGRTVSVDSESAEL